MPSARLKPYAPHLFYFGLIVLASGLPLSKFMMSTSQAILGAAWIMEGNYRERILLFLKNKIALMLSTVFIIHVLGLVYTDDFTYGLEDARKKIPLLILPFIFCTMPALTKKQTENILLIFVCSVLLTSFISLSIYLRIYERPFRDIRDISIFISHIRLGLMVCFSIFILLHRLTFSLPIWQKIVSAGIILWFLYFLFLLEAVTALSILAVILSILLIIVLIKTRIRVLKITIPLLFAAGCITGFIYLKELFRDFSPRETWSQETIPKKTANGNPYEHHFGTPDLENGYYTYLFICYPELEEEWNKRSNMELTAKDKKGQLLKATLLRFLTSKGLRKDAEGLRQLSDKEINLIENGTANIRHTGKSNFRGRIHALLWEMYNLKKGGKSGGHSLAMRFEFWKTACAIIADNPFAGVGTGDVKKAFAKKYRETNSNLEQRYRLRSHNQYLSIAVALGIPVMLFFIFTFIYPAFVNRDNVLYLVFSIIIILSMLTEDTLETQAGVTFYAFLNALFLFLKKEQGD